MSEDEKLLRRDDEPIDRSYRYLTGDKAATLEKLAAGPAIEEPKPETNVIYLAD
jgi:hypothetical protein